MIRTVGRHDGREIREAVLESATSRIAVLNYGALMRDWRVFAAGRAVPCILGFDSFPPYLTHSKSFGIVAGRVANRIANATFPLGGETVTLVANEGAHHLHGGPAGLGKQIWEMETATGGLILRHHSPEGAMGYPGRVDFEISMALDGPTLTLTMTGAPDRPTPINLAQHNYYNLHGSGDTNGHLLEIDAEHYTPVDATLIPTGAVLPVAGTRLDFRQMTTPAAQDPAGVGVDLNLVLRPGRPVSAPAARLIGPETGLGLPVVTDQPGLQLFNAPTMAIAHPGHDGAQYGAFAGICLEAQKFPDSPNRPDWPSVIATPEEPYRQHLSLTIAPVA